MPRRNENGKEYTAFGGRVRGLRKRLGWTQVELALHADISSSYLAEIERGGRNPSLETIINLAAALNINAGYLVDGSQGSDSHDLNELIERWPILAEAERRALLHLSSLFLVDKNEESPSPGKRPKTSL